jgi:hypothetical protein
MCRSNEPGFFRVCFGAPVFSETGDVTGAIKELKKRLVKKFKPN